MMHRHNYRRGMIGKPVPPHKVWSGLDYAYWVRNSEMADEELASLLKIKPSRIKQIRDLLIIPNKQQRNLIKSYIEQEVVNEHC